jgi:hypothetical protein
MKGGKFVTRKEKKRIRLQIINLLDTHCSSCNERNESSNSLCLTSCPIGKQMRQLSSRLEQQSINVVNIEQPTRKGRWTAEEEFYLWHHRKSLTLEELAEKLDRDKNAVYLKLRRLIQKGGISNVS